MSKRRTGSQHLLRWRQ